MGLLTILSLARAIRILTYDTTHLDEHNQDNWRSIAGYLTANADLLRADVAPAWLHALDGFLAIQRGQTVPCAVNTGIEATVKLWRSFAAMLGMDEYEIRKRRSAEQRETTRGLKGCYWYKCPLFQLDHSRSLREVELCSGCKQVGTLRPFSKTDTRLPNRAHATHLCRFNIALCIVRQGRDRIFVSDV